MGGGGGHEPSADKLLSDDSEDLVSNESEKDTKDALKKELKPLN